MFRKAYLILAILGFLFSLCYADMTDKATIGGIDSAGAYDWRVDSNGDIIPGTTGARNLGGSSNRLLTIYGTTIDGTSGLFTGDVYFRTSLLAAGRKGASSTLASSSTTLIPSTLPWCFIAKAVSGAGVSADNDPGTRLPAGTSGQLITMQVVALKTGGTWKISPDLNVMSSGWQSILLDTKGDNVTFI